MKINKELKSLGVREILVYQNSDKTWTWDMELSNGNFEYGGSSKSKSRAYGDAIDFAKNQLGR